MGLETSIGIGLSFGALFGGLLAWLALRSQTAALNARLSLMEKELAAGTADFKRLQEAHELLVASKARLESALESERKTSNEKIELVTQASEDLRNAFKAMASDALNSNNPANTWLLRSRCRGGVIRCPRMCDYYSPSGETPRPNPRKILR